jgi:alkylated DNA repair dioxygenase AlkB
MVPDETFSLPLDFGGESLPRNVLPQDGEAMDHGLVFAREGADRYLQILLAEIPWRHDEAKMFGKHIVTARKVAWYGDRNYDYTYSGRTRTALIWTPVLREIKAVVEGLSGASYNSCLLNLYADGSQGMGWHHDDEKGLGKNSNIASVSFGASRRFEFRHNRTREKVSVLLEHGSLLVMQGTTQSFWQHQVPKSLKVTAARINLTFRRMIESETRIGEAERPGEIR